ncbi:MAG: proton-conducting transporter membrane subunit, partial [Chryseotalea sp.]
MEKIINIFILIPLLGFLVSLVIPDKKEEWLSRVAFGTAGLNLIVVTIFTLYWILQGAPLLNMKDFDLFAADGYEFFIDFCFDKISVVFLLLGAMLTFLVTIYSRYYLHREEGYKRFFNTVLFFYLGYNLVTLSGNLETLFLGWEILGVSSFLLIAFYRDRYLPVKNAVKVFSIYRIADVGLILAMWLSHHLWLENITFAKLANYDLVHEHLQNHTWVGVAISVMILLAAAAKSAQLPFSSWLPRAMEGPTPSSAIFYGSLSVHMGVFLLLRTYHFWEHQIYIRIVIALVGLTTALVATGIARVQSSIKSQVAYSSIAQIGIIFIEVALGFTNLALFHIAGNAFLRTYQL